MASNDKDGKGQTAPRQIAGAAAPTPPAAAALEIPTLGTAAPKAEAQAVSESAPAEKAAEPSIPLSAVEMMIARHADANAQMMERMLKSAEERWARDRPAQITHHLDAISTTPDKILDMTVDGSLDDMARPDLEIARGDPMAFESHADELAFQEEYMIVNFSESTDPNDQPVFSLSVNGKPVWITRGVNTKLKRHYVEKAFRAKPEKVKITVGKNADGDVVNRVTKSSALAYPFQILHHGKSTERSKQWAQKMMREG